MGGMTAFNNPIGNWSNAYNMLNYVNSFLENGLTDQVQYNRTDPEVDKQIKLRLEGESYFLRAWWHFELLKMYGGKAKNGKALGIPLGVESVLYWRYVFSCDDFGFRFLFSFFAVRL